MLLTDVILIHLFLMLRWRRSYIISTFVLVFGHPEVHFNFTWIWYVSIIIQTMLTKYFWISWNGLCYAFYWYLGFIVWAHTCIP